MSCGKRHINTTALFAKLSHGTQTENSVKKTATTTYDDDSDDEIKSEIGTEEKRIVGGRDSLEGAWPWHVALMFKGEQWCAGALISPNWVVTAAHCFG